MDSAKHINYYTEEDYYNLPDDVRTELIDGVFYDMAAPSQLHQELVVKICSMIDNHISRSKGKCKVIPAPFDVKLEKDKDNIVQPDISVICDRDKLDGVRCNGAPDWIIEIVSPGSVHHDYARKLKLYQRAGVKEYWIVDPENESVTTYFFDADSAHIEGYDFTDTVKTGLFDTLNISFSEIMESINT